MACESLENKEMSELPPADVHTASVESAGCETRVKSTVGDAVNAESGPVLRRGNSSLA